MYILIFNWFFVSLNDEIMMVRNKDNANLRTCVLSGRRFSCAEKKI